MREPKKGWRYSTDPCYPGDCAHIQRRLKRALTIYTFPVDLDAMQICRKLPRGTQQKVNLNI